MSDDDLKAAMERVETLLDVIDTPDANRGDRDDIAALRMMLDAADLLLCVRSTVRP